MTRPTWTDMERAAHILEAIDSPLMDGVIGEDCYVDWELLQERKVGMSSTELVIIEVAYIAWRGLFNHLDQPMANRLADRVAEAIRGRAT